MKIKNCLVILLLALTAILISSGCTGESTPTLELPVPTVTPGGPGMQSTDEPETAPSATPEEVAAEEGSTGEEEEVVEEETTPEDAEPVAEDDQCINCHTDKQALIDTAKPEEEVESENEGEG